MQTIRTHRKGTKGVIRCALPVFRFILVSFLAFSLLLSLATPAYAGDLWTKFGRGIANILTFPIEVLNQPSQMGKTERWPIAIIGGIPKGVLYAAIRGVVGVYETVTFFMPIPEGYEPIMQPEYVISPH